MSKHYEINSMQPYSLSIFQQYQKANKGHDLENLDATNKQNKQIMFLHR